MNSSQPDQQPTDGAAAASPAPAAPTACLGSGTAEPRSRSLDAGAAAALKSVITSLDGITPEAQAALLQVVGGLQATPACESEGVAQPSASSPVASMTTCGHVVLPSACGDAGSCSFLPPMSIAAAAAAAVSAAAAPAGQPPLAIDVPDTAFAATEHQCRPLTPPAATAAGHQASRLAQAKSMVTHKTKALAVAAGMVRSGPVGCSLRLAGAMCRSSSGSLVDTLLSEAARAESGLLTAALPRSDSLPELMAAAAAAGGLSAELGSVPSILDLVGGGAGLSTMELPSLTLLFDAHTADALKSAGAMPPPSPIAAAGAGAAAALPAPEAEAPLVPPTWTASRTLGRPPSFSANSATALFAAHAAGTAAAPAEQQQQHPGLRSPPAKSEMIMLSAPAPGFAPGAGEQQPQHSSWGAAGAPGFGFDGHSMPSHHAMFSTHHRHALPLMMERQDTFDVLLRQVDAELTAEAEVRQYAALEFDTLDLAALGGGGSVTTHATGVSGGSLADLSGPSITGAVLASAAAGAQRPKRRSVFEVPAADGAGLLDPAACASFGSWVSGGSGGSMSASRGPASMTGGASPFLLPTGAAASSGAAAGVARAEPSVTAPAGLGMQAAAAAAAAAGGRSAPAGQGAAARGRRGGARGGAAGRGAAAAAAAGGTVGANGVEVARYSRVITCKTYLKRLNITQAMAEHLLPFYDLHAPPAAAAGAAAAASAEGERSYEALFKEEISLVDSEGASFRVTYEGVSCNAQKHLRLTSGWRDFIRAHDAAVGDSIVFERRGDERHVLYVTLVRGAGADALASRDEPDEAAAGAPAAKKRRVARSKAVQRLA